MPGRSAARADFGWLKRSRPSSSPRAAWSMRTKMARSVSHRRFRTVAPPLIVFRDVETNEPFQLLTGGGCVVSDLLPVFEAIEDARTFKWLEEGDGTLYVAFSLGDVIVCRACGLAATLAVGLKRCNDRYRRFLP